MNQHYKMKLKEMKKTLMMGIGYIRLSDHVKPIVIKTKKAHKQGRLKKRGYTKSDIISAIMTGEIVEIQQGFHPQLKRPNEIYVIEGKDTHHNPIVIVVGEDGRYQFVIKTVMPPLDKRRFKNCIS
ncbi:DUF4258 domain-containing protein [Gracilibacillus sp. YIM 98692]|uniref:DUF4258 domain-containing protein n=1 Tax=Gracilibacillus sp. YIM 98692 TaxID=2663532 RepID=UPI001F093345|nr:DUF4258 domain-containing protein [Gracilibacillus sp. YIM 98692]